MNSIDAAATLVVAKFGGTSMGDAEAMRKSAEIVRANARIRLVVVSATSATTNQLLDVSKSCQENNSAEMERKLDVITARHEVLARNLGCLTEVTSVQSKTVDVGTATIGNAAVSASSATAASMVELYREMRTTAKRLQDLRDGPEAPIFARSVTQYRGAPIVRAFFGLHSKAAAWKRRFLMSREIMITDEHFGKAEPNIAEIARRSEERLRPWIESHPVTVVQGFIGATSKGVTTTLGRGGSDFSAALLAESLVAAEVQIWTDVPGIMTMDPNAVSTARVIPQMSFAEAAELANFGAKVLHPATLWPAIRKRIRVFVGSTFQPQVGGTWIYAEVAETLAVRAIALRKNQTLITITSLRMLNAHGFLSKLFEILARYEMSVDLVTTSEVSVALTVDGASLGLNAELGEAALGVGASSYAKMVRELQAFSDVKIERDLTLVAVVGNGLNSTPGLSARTFKAVEQFNVRLICQGASSHNLCFLVNQGEAIEVANRLHQELIVAGSLATPGTASGAMGGATLGTASGTVPGVVSGTNFGKDSVSV